MDKVNSKDGTEIAYDWVGDGPPVILVDGALGSRTFGIMGPLSVLLAPSFTVITYDRRGRGESGDTPPYAVEREIEDLAALVEKARGKAFAFGISSGSVLAFRAAAQLKGITRLAMYEPPFIVDSTRPAAPQDFVPQLERLLASGRRGDMVELFMTQGVSVPAEVVARMRQQPFWPAMEALAPTLIYDITILEHSQTGEALPAEVLDAAASIHTPALVMAGGASPAWLRNAAQAAAQAIPRAQYTVLEGQTHAVTPEAIAPVLAEFFTADFGR